MYRNVTSLLRDLFVQSSLEGEVKLKTYDAPNVKAPRRQPAIFNQTGQADYMKKYMEKYREEGKDYQKTPDALKKFRTEQRRKLREKKKGEPVVATEAWPEISKKFLENTRQLKFKKLGPFYKFDTAILLGFKPVVQDFEELKYLRDNGYFPSEQEAFAYKSAPKGYNYTVYFNTHMPVSKDDLELIDAEEVSADEIAKMPPLRYDTVGGNVVVRGERIHP